MRVALVVSGGFDRSGRERVTPALLWLVERLARRHAVHVFVLQYYPDPCSYPLLGATVHDLGRADGPPGLRRSVQRRRPAAAIAAHGPFDPLHAYQGMPAIAAAAIARRLRLPLVATLDSGELTAIDDIGYGLQRRWFDRRALAHAIRGAACLTVSTTFMAGMIPGDVDRARVAIVPLGVAGGAFARAARVEGLPWRLLRVASLNAVKDYPALLQAAAAIVGRGVDAHLDVVGEDTMAGAMQTLAGALALERRVTFHGFQPIDQLAPFYARAHLHLVTSRHEAAGVTVLEAAVTGLATVGTRAGYVADWDPDRAVAVPAGDPDALANAVIDLLQDRERRERDDVSRARVDAGARCGLDGGAIRGHLCQGAA